MKVDVELVKAFTNDKDLGNPAGVVHDANKMSDEQMLKIAGILGYSESAFIQKSDKADFQVRFFAVKEEVDFCGHATIAAFYSLARNGYIKPKENGTKVTQETKAGVFPVMCYPDGKIMMSQESPKYMDTEIDKKQIAKLLGIAEPDFAQMPIQIVSTVYPMLVIPISTLAALKQIKPDFDGLTQYSTNHQSVGFYAFTTESGSKDVDFATRFFNPRLGINEDPATGVAAGSLGGYADKYVFKGKQKQMVISQGFDMGMPSTIYVDLFNGVQVGGYATNFGQREVEV